MEIQDQILLDRQLSVLYKVLGIRPEHSTILSHVPPPPPPPMPVNFARKRRERVVGKVKIENENMKSEEEENSALKPTTRNKKSKLKPELVLKEVKYPAPCRFCGKLQKNVHVLTHHEKIHTGEKPHICAYCSRAFAWKQSWKSHQMRCETKSQNSHSKENQSVKIQNGSKLQSTRSNAVATFKANFNQRARNRNVQGYSARAQAGDVQKTGTPKKNLGKENKKSKPKFSFKSSISASVTKINNKKKRSVSATAAIAKTKRRIRRASKKSAKPGAFDCQICHKPNRSMAELILHQRVHTGEQPFSCKFCQKNFSWKQNRDVHQLKVCKLRGITAPATETTETSQSDLPNGACTGLGLGVDVLRNGNNNSNIQKRKPGRPKGSLTTTTRTKARTHLKPKVTSPGPSQHRKKNDNKPSQVLPKTKAVLKTTPPNEPSTSGIKLKLPSFNFSCKYCLKRFCKYSELELHERQSHIFNVKPYICNSCPRRFISISPCQNHQKLHNMMSKIKYKIKIHDKFGPYRHYRVQKLTKNNRRRQNQNNHLVLDGNENETENPKPPPAAMTLPFAEFMGVYGGLNDLDNDNHNIPIVNAGAGASTGPRPGSGTGTNRKTKGKKSQLSRAAATNENITRVKVDGIQKFRCNQCRKLFASNRNAVHHLQIHDRDHNHNRDRKRKRSELKQHTCSFCSRVFTQKGNLIVHERIHTGEEPYSCTRCKKTFKALAGLHYHLGKFKNGTTCVRVL